MSVQRIDPEHVYRSDDGRTWPGVTSILGAVPPWLGRFDKIPTDVLELKREIGTAVRLAIALDAEGALDEATVDPAVAAYLVAWRRFKAEASFAPRWVETTVWHPTFGFAGTLDGLGVFEGRRPRKVLLDVKTGSDQDADLAGPQTAAYLEAARVLGLAGAEGVVERCSVHLRDDGTYRVVPHTNRRDWQVFLAALELFNFALGRK
jgi:hypothetical protein